MTQGHTQYDSLAAAMQALLGPPTTRDIRKALAMAAHTALTTRGFAGAPPPVEGDGNFLSSEYTMPGYENGFSLLVVCRGDNLLLTLVEGTGPAVGSATNKGLVGLSCSRYAPHEASDAEQWDAIVDVDGLGRVDALVDAHLVTEVLANATRKPVAMPGVKSEHLQPVAAATQDPPRWPAGTVVALIAVAFVVIASAAAARRRH
jgi:hypothetical protein